MEWQLSVELDRYLETNIIFDDFSKYGNIFMITNCRCGNISILFNSITDQFIALITDFRCKKTKFVHPVLLYKWKLIQLLVPYRFDLTILDLSEFLMLQEFKIK